ncbi:MAG TPA: aldose 1-epimerase [Actinomycetota bacterium]|nr:aldose 1-epimerase [Actinomycetota bacterium]
MPRAVDATEGRFRGEPAIVVRAGPTRATFLPHLGLTGVSLRHDGGEYLAVPGGLDTLRRGGSAGIPLLAPWANRLAGRRYRAAGVDVDLRGLRLGVDDHGLPIHGLLLGRSRWRVDRVAARGDAATFAASIEVDARAFPFPHRIEVGARVRPGELQVTTTIVSSGRRRVPVAFGWHPYLRVPGTPRARWRLRLPARGHRLLDDRSIPTGASVREPAEDAAVGRRTFDDLYALGRDRRLAFEGADGRSVELWCGTGYPFAQVWVPAGRTFGALEPMAAPTNALVEGTTPLVRPGERFRATFALRLT